MKHFVLLNGWLYVRHPKVYREFLEQGCRVNFIGCGAGHYQGCDKAEKGDK